METNDQNKIENNTSQNEDYRNYMNFCDKYGEKIDSALNTLKDFLHEIPKDATLYIRSDIIEQTISGLAEINEWIVETKQLSEEDFNYE